MTSELELVSCVVEVVGGAGACFPNSTCGGRSDLMMGFGFGSRNSAVPVSCKALGLGGGGVIAPLPGALARMSAEGFQRSRIFCWSICWYCIALEKVYPRQRVHHEDQVGVFAALSLEESYFG